MNKILYNHLQKAKAEGRICRSCGWIITVKNWKKGFLLCSGCWDAVQGVNVSRGHYQPMQEPEDKTGDML